MNDNKMNNDKLEALLKTASQRLGTTPEALKAAAQRGDLSSVLKGSDGEALKKVLTDPEAAKKLLSTTQAQSLLNMLNGK